MWGRIKETVNILGSIASITGISIIYLKISVPDVEYITIIPIALVGSLFVLFLSSVVVLVFRLVYDKSFNYETLLPYQQNVKIIVISIFGAASIMVLTFFVYITYAVTLTYIKKLLVL